MVVTNLRPELQALGGVIVRTDGDRYVVGMRNAEATRVGAAIYILVPLDAGIKVNARAAMIAKVGVHVVRAFLVSFRHAGEDRRLRVNHLGVDDLIDAVAPVVLDAQFPSCRIAAVEESG